MLGRARPFCGRWPGKGRGSPSIKARLKMILTQCPVCAAELPPLSAKQCSRCKTRYCGPACQKQHWEAGGHDKLCKKIRKGGGAEQYNAIRSTQRPSRSRRRRARRTRRARRATSARRLSTGRRRRASCAGAACRGTAGFAHVSCLAEQAKILVAEAEENNLGVKVQNERYSRWHTCSLCEQQHHGVVRCALGWACWKTYVGRPEADWAFGAVRLCLGTVCPLQNHHEDALSVQEAEFVYDAAPWRIRKHTRRAGQSCRLRGRSDGLKQGSADAGGVYSGRLQLDGEEHRNTLIAANNYAASLRSSLLHAKPGCCCAKRCPCRGVFWRE